MRNLFACVAVFAATLAVAEEAPKRVTDGEVVFQHGTRTYYMPMDRRGGHAITVLHDVPLQAPLVDYEIIPHPRRSGPAWRFTAAEIAYTVDNILPIMQRRRPNLTQYSIIHYNGHYRVMGREWTPEYAVVTMTLVKSSKSGNYRGWAPQYGMASMGTQDDPGILTPGNRLAASDEFSWPIKAKRVTWSPPSWTPPPSWADVLKVLLSPANRRKGGSSYDSDEAERAWQEAEQKRRDQYDILNRSR